MMQRGAARAWAGRAWPVIALAVAALATLAPFLLSPRDAVIDTPDVTHYLLWLHEYSRAQLSAGRWPLWCPSIYAGVPFAANPQASVFYPASWFYLVTSVPQGHKASIALHVLLTGGFMYLCLRQLVRGRWAAAVGALPWMLGSYFVFNACVGHFPLLFAAAWLPLAMWCYEHALRGEGPRWLFWTGVVLGVQGLAGEPQIGYYTALLLAVYGLARAAGSVRAASGRLSLRPLGAWLLGLGLIASVTAIIAGAQLLPTAEMALASDRRGNTFEFATINSFAWTSAWSALVPWSPQVSEFKVGDAQASVVPVEAYLGIAPWLFVGASLFRRGSPPLRGTRVAFLVAMVLMLGRYTPLYRPLFFLLPGLAWFRTPARAGVIALWALCVMAAYGAEWVFEEGPRRWRRASWLAAAAGGLAAMAAALITPVLFTRVMRPVAEGAALVAERVSLTDPLVARPLLVILGTTAALVAAQRQRRSVAQAIILIALGIDLWVSSPAVPWQRLADPPPDLRLLRTLADASAEPFRVDFAPSHIAANAAMVAGVENVNGYWPLAPARFYRFVHAMRGVSPPSDRRHELADALYTSPNPFPLRILNVLLASKVDLHALTVQTLHDPRPLPRAWVVHSAATADDETALALLRRPEFDPARVVLLPPGHASPPAPETPEAPDEPDEVRVRVLGQGDLEVRTLAATPGYLVLSQPIYPGWRAEIDGRPAGIRRADYLLAVVDLPSGPHTVRYFYAPWSVKLGLACSALGITAAILVLAGTLRQGRGRRNEEADTA